jgi:serine/threonine protein kinase
VVACELMEGELKIPESGFKPEEALVKLKQFLLAYAELYRRGMYHRDIKPQNILVAGKGTIMKLSDFGAARG